MSEELWALRAPSGELVNAHHFTTGESVAVWRNRGAALASGIGMGKRYGIPSPTPVRLLPPEAPARTAYLWLIFGPADISSGSTGGQWSWILSADLDGKQAVETDEGFATQDDARAAAHCWAHGHGITEVI